MSSFSSSLEQLFIDNLIGVDPNQKRLRYLKNQQVESDTRQMLEVYAQFAEEWLALPVVKGVKTENERFAGAVVLCAIAPGRQPGDNQYVESLQRLVQLMQAAKSRGDHQVVLHAQCSAEGFYKRSGFVPQGDIFEEAGIAHIEMVRTL